MERFMGKDKQARCDWCLEWQPTASTRVAGANATKCDDCFVWDQQHPEIAHGLESGA